ncbi:E3 ubiquitin-protein ligase Topors-like [Neosynchiropus ocellatus]
MSRLAARLRVQREGGLVRPLREREAIAFRRSLYRSSIQVTGIAGINGNQQQQDISAESFRSNPVALHRLRPWLRRELTVLYGAHSSLVDIVQRFIMSCLVRHGLQDIRILEDEMRPFLLARTNHFLHELVCFARSPLSLDLYDQQAVYEPLSATMEIDGSSSSSDSSSVIAISEGEENEETTIRPEEQLLGDAVRDSTNGVNTGSNLSLSGWDDETPGPSYSTAEQSSTLPSDSLSPPSKGLANENAKEKPADEEGEEECLIIGYKKPIAERTPELVQLSSDSEVEDEKKVEKAADKTPPPSYLPAISASTSGACQDEQHTSVPMETHEKGSRLHTDSWSDSSDSGFSIHLFLLLLLIVIILFLHSAFITLHEHVYHSINVTWIPGSL